MKRKTKEIVTITSIDNQFSPIDFNTPTDILDCYSMERCKTTTAIVSDESMHKWRDPMSLVVNGNELYSQIERSIM